jgi:hypothetical protein
MISFAFGFMLGVVSLGVYLCWLIAGPTAPRPPRKP